MYESKGLEGSWLFACEYVEDETMRLAPFWNEMSYVLWL